jgi:hypothetical protein
MNRWEEAGFGRENRMKFRKQMGIAVFALLFAVCGSDGRAEGKEIVFEDESMMQRICLQLGKEEDRPLYEEELEARKGELELTGVVGVHSGEELDVLRTYFRLENVYQWNVEFTPDLEGWTEEQLKGLGDLRQTVRICSSEGHTVPASVLPCFTGTEELEFEVTDVTGRLPEGKAFPDNIRRVSFLSHATARYTNLLACMQGSGVEELVCFKDSRVKAGTIFWLDEAAGCKELEYLDVGDSRIRALDAEKLEGMKLRELAGVVDQRTDLSFVNVLPALEKVTGAVVDERDLAPLLEKEELGLRLRFCQEVADFEESIYPDGGVIINPEWDAYFDWKEEEEEDGNFLAIYQRCMDEGRKVECFSVRAPYERKEEYGPAMYNVRTFLRVTDGDAVTLLAPECIDSEHRVFGDYQSDRFRLMDINFDGVKDIVLDQGSFGNQGAHYEYGWIWDKMQGEYVFSESYGGIMNPGVDGEHKLVRSSWRNWAASHSWAIFRYENGEFVCKSTMTEELLRGEGREDVQTPEGAEVWQWTEEIYGDNGEVETKSFTVADVPGEKTEYPEEYYRFYEEDSYWGG